MALGPAPAPAADLTTAAEVIIAEYPPMISISTAARITGVSRRTLNRYVDEGLLPATQVGPRKVVRVLTRDLVGLFRVVPTATELQLQRRRRRRATAAAGGA